MPAFVGAGKGCYRQETTYKYVGDGAGTFALAERVSPGTSAPSRSPTFQYICCACIACLFCVLPWLVFWGLPHLHTPTHSANPGNRTNEQANGKNSFTHEHTYGRPADTFDCSAGLDNWESGWADDKIDWCCEHKQVACRKNQPCTSGCDHHDCLAGFAAWESVWSDDKKLWCCQHRNRGCPESTTTMAPFDCDAGYTRWRLGWSEDKKRWCCEKRGRGCQTTSTPVISDAVISDGLSHALLASTSRAVISTSAPIPYDCLAGVADWENSWSEIKRNWCCSHDRKFCPGHLDPI